MSGSKTATLPPFVVEAISRLAKERGVTMVDVLRDAVTAEAPCYTDRMRYEPLTRRDVEELHDMLARIDTNPGLSQVVGRITATLVDLQQQVDELRARLDSIDDEGESKP